jgi:hypothetical protein
MMQSAACMELIFFMGVLTLVGMGTEQLSRVNKAWVNQVKKKKAQVVRGKFLLEWYNNHQPMCQGNF